MPDLPRTLRVGNIGADVEGAKRGVSRLLGKGRLSVLVAQAPLVRRTFGPFFRTDVKRAQGRLEVPMTGVFGPATFDALRAADKLDARALALFKEYEDSQKPRLVEPRQGFSSLHKSLWSAYSLGRSRGLTDLGTYNPASRLPGGGPSDHAVHPAYAFDLGVEPDTGWANLVGRNYAIEVIEDPAVEYVILGDKINTKDGRGWRPYTAGGHLNHVHVSGRR